MIDIECNRKLIVYKIFLSNGCIEFVELPFVKCVFNSTKSSVCRDGFTIWWYAATLWNMILTEKYNKVEHGEK